MRGAAVRSRNNHHNPVHTAGKALSAEPTRHASGTHKAPTEAESKCALATWWSFSTVFHAAGSGTAETSSLSSQSRLADLSRTSTFSRNIRHPRLRTCICPFTIVHVLEVDHCSLVCSIFRDSRHTATSIAHDVGKYSRTARHRPTTCHSTPGAHSTRATHCA
jgi:hypothetical protein